jgi:chaperonin GroES
MILKPHGNRIVVNPVKEEDNKSASGIIIPDSVTKEKPMQGTVMASGTPDFTEGQTVLFSKFAYDEVKVDNIIFYVISANNVLATIL